MERLDQPTHLTIMSIPNCPTVYGKEASGRSSNILYQATSFKLRTSCILQIFCTSTTFCMQPFRLLANTAKATWPNKPIWPVWTTLPLEPGQMAHSFAMSLAFEHILGMRKGDTTFLADLEMMEEGELDECIQCRLSIVTPCTYANLLLCANWVSSILEESGRVDPLLSLAGPVHQCGAVPRSVFYDNELVPRAFTTIGRVFIAVLCTGLALQPSLTVPSPSAYK